MHYCVSLYTTVNYYYTLLTNVILCVIILYTIISYCVHIYIYTYYHYIIKERGRNIPLLGVDLLVAVLVEEGEYFSELLDLLLYYYYYYYY